MSIIAQAAIELNAWTVIAAAVCIGIGGLIERGIGWTHWIKRGPHS